MISYLSGMRSGEVRELAPDCAFTETGPDGRIRHKLRGRVLKGRKLTGEEAEWVVLDIVHQAVALLATVNDDPTHLFGHKGMTSNSLVLFGSVNRRLNDFRDHLNELFSTPDSPYVPLPTATPAPDNDTPAHDEPEREEVEEEPMPWRLSTRQFRRTLAWHIAHQPFGVVAGARSTSTPNWPCSKATRVPRPPGLPPRSLPNAPSPSWTTSRTSTATGTTATAPAEAPPAA
ncbi:hypothetical protein [Streptomyces sp. NPDC059224]|uniref:hypothetical protein n=1 Tax=Streptomyces sp. NPDC059224 TaxID=3346775 RepID=UPI0036C4E368